MFTTPSRTLRYVHTWLTGRARVAEEFVSLERGGTTFRAKLAHPAHGDGPWPTWIVLHGITRTGLEHRQLVRFTRALASTGAAVFVPEVPEWTRLDLAPRLALPTILSSIAALDSMERVRSDRYGLVGFSFGAPHAIATLAEPAVAERIAGAIGFGGYCHLERTIRFMFTGAHEHGGKEHHIRPDPYGRWIVASNYLTAIPGLDGATDVATELRGLAALAGDTGAVAWDPVYDAAKVEARERIALERLPLFDLIAPPSDREPDPIEGAELATRLTEASKSVAPEMDAAPALARVRRPVHVLHGRRDHLIPFSEGLRLHEALPESTRSYATVTRLFGHSAQDPFPSVGQAMREVPMFLRAMARVLTMV